MGEMITIPMEEYRQLQVASADLADLRAYDQALATLPAGDDEQVPSEFADRILTGESPLRVWREYRGLTRSALAAASCVNRVQIINIEDNGKTGSVETVKKLADALNVLVDDLV